MKVLQINTVYRIGSTGKIMYDIHSELIRKGYESVVCYSRSQDSTCPSEVRVCGKWYSRFNILINKLTGLTYGGCLFSTYKIISLIEKENPDIVHLQCLNGCFVNIYTLLEYLKRHKIKTVLTLHAEFMYTGGCGYAYECDQWTSGCRKCPDFRMATGSAIINRTSRMVNMIASIYKDYQYLQIIGVSDWITERAKKSIAMKGCSIRRIHNGIKLDTFVPADMKKKCDIQKKYKISTDEKIIISVNPRFDDPVKGGDIFCEIAQRLSAKYKIILIGSDIQSDYFISIPFISNQEDLAAFYSIADAFIITSRIDNYPTVCIEANCCGTPVVGFDVGGISETIGTGMGETVPAYDVESLCRCASEWAEKKYLIPKELIDKRRTYCSKERMTADYIQLYQEMMEEK